MMRFAVRALCLGGTAGFRRLTSQVDHPMHFCIVGTGPAGFYTADRLLKRLGRQVRVDLLDRLPTPFGLVRSGVAPDHQPTKNVINQFSAVALDERVRFLGNVRLGLDVNLMELRAMYTGVVLCTGAEGDKRLNIPGEDGPGVLSARRFVWWYNGHPDCFSMDVDLSTVKSVAVCGIGNVALDCARVLLRSPTEGPLATSDMAGYALDMLRKTAGLPREVHLVARRGPVQAACTAKELKELVSEPRVRVHAPADQMALSQEDLALIKSERSKRRLYEIITQAAAANPGQADTATPTDPSNPPTRDLHFQFYRQPRQVLRDPASGEVVGLEVERTALVPSDKPGGKTTAVGTGELSVIPAQLVLVSIGYRSLPVVGAAFDEDRGLIPNIEGRALLPQQPASDPEAAEEPEVDVGLYVCGWLKRGPTGIIGTNAADAEETVSSILQDIQAARLPWPPPAHTHTVPGTPASASDPTELLLALLQRRGVKVVDFAGWLRIDSLELEGGFLQGRVRDKMTQTERMVRLATGT